MDINKIKVVRCIKEYKVSNVTWIDKGDVFKVSDVTFSADNVAIIYLDIDSSSHVDILSKEGNLRSEYWEVVDTSIYTQELLDLGVEPPTGTVFKWRDDDDKGEYKVVGHGENSTGKVVFLEPSKWHGHILRSYYGDLVLVEDSLEEVLQGYFDNSSADDLIVTIKNGMIPQLKYVGE